MGDVIERLKAAGDGMLPDALAPVSAEWYQLCERASYVDKIKISGELAEAIVAAVCATSAAAREAAAALEAAREDGLRLEWLEREAEVGIRLHNGDFNGRHVGLGLTVWNTRRTLRQAIDQARGKGVSE